MAVPMRVPRPRPRVIQAAEKDLNVEDFRSFSTKERVTPAGTSSLWHRLGAACRLLGPPLG
jgi:hypothetical protein